MKVLFLTQAQNIYLIPRYYPEAGDVLTLSLRNEFTEAILTPAVTWTIASQQLIVNITTQPTDFKTQKKYELTLKNGVTTIFYDKIIVLDAGTDVQNYEYKSQTTAKFEYKQ